jgi:Flp pilus assembly protein TadB
VVPGGSAARIDAADLRALASASKAVLGSVARDARDRLADRRQERKAEHGPTPRRRRFKRRWVVVPALTALVLLVLILAGAALGLALIFGHL